MTAALALPDKYDRDPGLEPRAGDVVARNTRGGVAVVREVIRTFWSPFARQRFVVYRRPSGQCASLALESWRRWAGVSA